MKTITITLYEFQELTKEQQAKVIDKHRYVNVDHEGWYLWLFDEYTTKLEALGFCTPSFYFSLFSQGSGACFDCYYFDLQTYLKATKQKTKYRALKSYDVEFSIYRNNYANHYSHEKTRYVDLSDCSDYPYRLVETVRALMADVEAERIELCRQLFKELETLYEELISDRSIIDTILANDWMFNGETLEIEN